MFLSPISILISCILDTAGTAPPSTISCDTDLGSGLTFATANGDLAMPNAVSADATFVTAHQYPMFFPGFYPNPPSLVDSIGFEHGGPDLDVIQISPVEDLPASVLNPQHSEVVANDPNPTLGSPGVAPVRPLTLNITRTSSI